MRKTQGILNKNLAPTAADGSLGAGDRPRRAARTLLELRRAVWQGHALSSSWTLLLQHHIHREPSGLSQGPYGIDEGPQKGRLRRFSLHFGGGRFMDQFLVYHVLCFVFTAMFYGFYHDKLINHRQSSI